MSEMNRKRPFSTSGLTEDDNAESVEPKQKLSDDDSNNNARRRILPNAVHWAINAYLIAKRLANLGNRPPSLPFIPSPPLTEGIGANDPLDLDSVGGLPDQVKYIREHIIAAMRDQDALREHWGYEPEKGIIFYGPPGTGKTLLAKALAGELKKNGLQMKFYMIKWSNYLNMWLGQTERFIREMFATAKQNSPCILFWDELDGIAPNRSNLHPRGFGHCYVSILTTILIEIDDVNRGEILLIGATNRLNSLDPALIRPGRFGKHLEFTAPNEEGRLNILNLHLSKWLRKPSAEDLTHISRETRDYTGADLEQLCRHAFDYAKERVIITKNNRPLSDDDISSMSVVLKDWTKAISASSKKNNANENLPSFYT